MAACIVVLSLYGCGTQPRANVDLPPSLLQECPDLNKLGGTTGEDLLKNITDNSALYHACKESKHALIEAVKPK